MDQSKLKVMAVLGTRPEIIRLSRVLAALDRHCELTIVHTGQNYDYELNEIFFAELGVRKPDYFLNAAGDTVGQTVGEIIAGSEKVMMEHRPDAMIVLGDTNSALSAYVARRLQIPVYHMEAGNRCFDGNVPEETNRKLVDHISDFNLAYTEHARRNLLAEGLPTRRVYVTGSPMFEVLNYYKSGIEQSKILEVIGLTPQQYIVASIHREENVDSNVKLENLVRSLKLLVVDHSVPIIVSTHPRTRARLEQNNLIGDDPMIRWMKPFSYFDYNHLQVHSLCVVSDSGTIAEESSVLKFSAVTPRLSIERPEAMDTGAIVVCGNEPVCIRAACRYAIANLDGKTRAQSQANIPTDYQIDNTSHRVVSLIVGTAKLSNKWAGIEQRVSDPS